MKVISKIFMLMIAGTLFYSCDDFLEEAPRDEISLNQFFTEPAHAENAVNALYRVGAPQMYLTGGVYSGKWGMYGPYLSGFFDNEYKGQEPYIQFAQQLTLNGTNIDGFSNGIWSDMYLAIARANNAIKYIPSTPGLAEDVANRLMAEARFFRAYAYFFLVRLYGEVPLIEEPYEAIEEIYVASSPVADIYDLIVSDLEFAVNEGGLSELAMVNNGYRVTEGAAATLLADVYLTMSGYPLQEDHYADAADMAQMVINSGTYSLVQNDLDELGEIDFENSAYNKIRRDEALAEEYIYLAEYMVGIETSTYPQWSYPVAYASEVEYAITNGAFQPVEEFMWGYDQENDLRAQNKQYFHTTFTNEDGTTSTFPPTPYIWHDDQALFQTATSGKDARALSYSEVLLTAAESIARSEGVTAEAVNYLAQVRDRAYWMQDIGEIEAELTGLSVDEFVEEVWEERYRELVFDFKLWFDMIRTRTYPLTSANGNGEIDFVPLVGQQNTWGQTFQDRHLLLPIPQRELQRNPELEQNNGYTE
ncbi:RagB/SusD family nutrient uptake outer membrane protein [Catalinimonas niigatensis]|uniref:RagB/SusD family nutrient uptake outer membrane protein n=1 Tax=Catalinimonas niigatensis TaxID=1397264 RepID=UPI002664E820|nr:RagB/SusD family nutrient uptake outer membrane protein [Catalinimonas niigatensis]WPP51736.1 RagB/SusD family nutrient uptake outer membrane protein [Catalinimonas niigatensis]